MSFISDFIVEHKESKSNANKIHQLHCYGESADLRKGNFKGRIQV